MKPPFTITSIILNYLIEISKVLGNLEIETKKNFHLRKENRIKSIHSSLAIENNSLSIEQITAIIDGKRVLGDPKEIKEVKNAYEAYEKILNLDPYSEKDFLIAHKLLTTETVGQSGKYRNSDVGIFILAVLLISVVAVKDIEESFNKYFSTRKIKKSVR